MQSPKEVNKDSKINSDKLMMPNQENQSVTDSQLNFSESSGVLKSSLNMAEAQEILVFPYRRIMPKDSLDHKFPHEFTHHVLSATKQYIQTSRNDHQSPLKIEQTTPVMSGTTTKGKSSSKISIKF